MKNIYTLFITAPIISFTGCFSAQLTKEGNHVKYVTKQEAPEKCKEIGEVNLDGLIWSQEFQYPM